MIQTLIALTDAGSDLHDSGFTAEKIGWAGNSLFLGIQTLIMWKDSRKKTEGGTVISRNRSLLERFWPLLIMAAILAAMWSNTLYNDSDRRDSIYILVVILLTAIFVLALLVLSIFFGPFSSTTWGVYVGNVKYKRDLIDTMSGKFNNRSKGIFWLHNDDRISTREFFVPPVAFKLTAMTDSTDLRISYAAKQIIFRWNVDNKQLRIDGGPLDGQHGVGIGDIPVKAWVEIDLIVRKNSMSIFLDGRKIYQRRANFSTINEQFSVFQGHDAIIGVKSLLTDRQT